MSWRYYGEFYAQREIGNEGTYVCFPSLSSPMGPWIRSHLHLRLYSTSGEDTYAQYGPTKAPPSHNTIQRSSHFINYTMYYASTLIPGLGISTEDVEIISEDGSSFDEGVNGGQNLIVVSAFAALMIHSS